MVNRAGLREDGKLKKGYRFKDGKIVKSQDKKCKELVGKKIGTTMKEYKKGRFVSKEQAIAVGFKTTIKEHPECKKNLRKK